MLMTIKADYREFIAEDAELLAIMSVLAGATPVLFQRSDRLIAIATSALCLFLLSFLIIRYIMLVNVRWLVEGYSPRKRTTWKCTASRISRKASLSFSGCWV